MSPETKTCQNCKTSFTIEPDDFSFYEKIKVPPPTFCPECRLIRRLSFRNEKSLYRNQCQKCGQSVISVYPKDSCIVVYCRPCWWGDSWDGADYGRDFDESKPFITQFKELLYSTPLPSLFGIYTTLVNSEYANMVTALKNCYMITHSDFSENCLYGSVIDICKDSVDNLILTDSELCYETVDCQKCYHAMYSVDCDNCHDVYFSRNCIGCSDCLGCVNLKNKKYCIWNEQYSKEEYKEKIKELKLDSHTSIQSIMSQAKDFWNKFPQKYMHERHNADVSGDYVYNSKNTHDSFIVSDMEDSRFCAYVTHGVKTTNCYDFTHYGIASDLMYESLQTGNHASRIRFCWYTVLNTSDMEYSVSSTGCKDCFGCVGLKKKEYCILNKQYTKEEYFTLRDKIVNHMNSMPYVDKRGLVYKYGEFFPSELSPFGYNATTAQEFFPLTKDEIQKEGFNWKETEDRSYSIDILPDNLEDTMENIDEQILNKIIGCEHSGSCSDNCSVAFKLTPEEFQFYKKLNIPVPHLCPNCRHSTRTKFRNPMKLWHRKCMKDGCQNEFETSYSPDRPEIVYCEKCYQQEVV
ncbi:MAG: hypothetical protein WCK91_00255 [bacterium]